MSKKKSSILLLLMMTFLAVFCGMGASCEVTLSQAQSEHVCAYGMGPTLLRQEKDSEPHDIEAAITSWANDGTAENPTVLPYSMAYDYTLAEGSTITLGKYVYIGVCVHSAALTFTDEQIVLSYEETTDEAGNTVQGEAISGFYVYDCERHGCYAAMSVATGLSESYLEFSYRYALKIGATAISVPAGAYALNEEIALSEWIESGKITLQDAANTSLCLKNVTYDGYETEIEKLTALGVTVYTECYEPVEDHTNHTCAYIPQEGMSMGLDQETFNYFTSELAANPGALTPSTEDPLSNYIYVHLTEDISSDVALTIPDGLYFGICKNGFEFDVPDLKGAYVFDCTPHVCVFCDLGETIPLWQAGLDMSAAYMAELNKAYPEVYTSPIPVLGSGCYALMEDFDVETFPATFDSTAEMCLCLNGHTIVGLEESLTQSENVWDCTLPVVEEEGTFELHACSQLSPHISAIPITEETANGIVDENGAFAFKGMEVALSLTFDVQTDMTLTVATGTKLHLCLNGYKILGTQALGESDSPYIIRVEYGAELYVYDCSAERTGAMIAATEEMLTVQENSISMYTSPICNFGYTQLNRMTAQGCVGVYNMGDLEVNDSNILGIYFGIMQSEADGEEYPLHTKTVSVETEGSEITGAMVGVFALGGDVALEDTTINATMIGIMAGAELGDLNAEQAKGDLTIADVEVNLTKDLGEASMAAEEIGKSLGSVMGIVTSSDVLLEGDLVINVDSDVLQPYINDDGEVVNPTKAEFVMTGGQIEVADGVELSDTYDLYLQTTEEESAEGKILANQDISENFVLMQGLAGALNSDGNYEVISGENATFMNNAIPVDVAVSFDGYVRLEFYCYFDQYEEYESFLNNEKSAVLLTVADQKVEVNPKSMESLGDNLYRYCVDFYAKDYQDKIRVQFTNGEYTWTGMTSISVEDFLRLALVSVEQQIAVSDDILATDASEKAAASATLTYTEQQVADAKYAKEESLAYKNAIIAMLNYCDVAALQFNVDPDYTLLDKEFSHKSTITVVDEETQEEIVEETWTNTTLTAAMDGVTAETLAAYKATVAEGSAVPQGVTFIGASLILNSGTDIRFYFRASTETLNGLTVTLNGETAECIHHSGNIYYVQVKNLSATEMKNMYELTVTDGTDSFSISYGVFSYMYGVLSNAEADATLVNVAKATWLYANEVEKTMAALSALEKANGEEGTTDENV